MNHWLLIRRLRGPAFVLLFGITALLDQWHIISFFRSWPLYLILLGVLNLAERAALAAAVPPVPPTDSTPGASSSGSTSIVPTAPGSTTGEGRL
jgi:hypothetical protein